MKTHFIFICIAFFLMSCTTKKEASKLNYMQNIEQIATETAMKNSVNTIQPGDQLVILVTAKDNLVTKPFNQNYSHGESLQPIISSGNQSINQTPISGPTYIVDSNGNIDFPVIGMVNTTGKTLETLKEDLKIQIESYVKNPTVNIRHTNFKITILGEVNRPGPYTIPDGNTTILQAIGLAGEITQYGKRDDVLIVRNENGKIQSQRINLTDASFVNSPYYFLKQGDVIHVSANKNKETMVKTNPNTTLYISAASVAITAIAVIFGILKK